MMISNNARLIPALCLALLSMRCEAAAPSITSQPLSQSVALGATVALTPAVSGTAPLGYQWWKDGSLLAGATSSSLTLTNAQITNSGAYYLVATNSAGTAVSIPALVNAGAPVLFAWGDNSSGEFGDGITNTRAAVPLNTSNNAVASAAGADFTLFVDGNGNLWATGTNASGQLGIGSTAASTNVQTLVTTGVVAVAAGYQHSLFVKSNGSLWAMGDNSFGQLGVATNITTTNQPVYVATNVVAVAAGYQHSLFLKNDGTIWAMGENYYGQLGIGSDALFTSQPQMLSGGGAAVTAGGHHSLFITTSGILWGAGNNLQGELGIGTNVTTLLSPVPIATNVISAAAGYQHSLFVKNDGSLWSMGTNSFGQLGLNENLLGANFVPEMVAQQGITNVVAVTAGLNHSLFKKSDGSLWAMGNDQSGQLGDNGNDALGLNAPDYNGNIVPVPVVAPGLLCASVRSGPAANHSLCAGIELVFPPAVSSSGGDLTNAGTPIILSAYASGTAPLAYQWWKDGVMLVGATNSSFTLSNAQAANSGAYYVVVTNLAGAAVSVPQLLTIASPILAAWGDNTDGQFGNGAGGYVTNAAVLTANSALIMAAGHDSTVFVGGSNGPLWTAGLNGNGQLGDGSSVNTSNAQRISLSNAVAAASGQYFSLFVSNGTLWGMGDNSYGQLGLGAGVSSTNLPVTVSTNVTLVAAGNFHSLFVKGNGTLWGVGFNEDGELGLGNYTSTYQPAMSASNVAAVAAGDYHSLFIKVDGSLWGMGVNASGQLGLGTNVAGTNLPALVATNVIAVAAGFEHSLFIKNDGTLWAMGDNTYGQLGLGSGVSGTNQPAFVASNVVAVAAGFQHSLFEKGDGSLWTMGNNAAGQLGDGTFNTSYAPEQILPGFSAAAIASGPAANHTLVAGVPLPPSVTQPGNQSASPGGTISFSASATGYGVFSYQWLKNGAMIVGATNSTLTLTNAQLSASGLYNVVVSNIVGMAISIPALAAVSTTTILSCGDNDEGELGLGSFDPTSTNSPAGTTNAAIFASAGNYFSLFIDGRGVLWSVGENDSGQLGIGTNVYSEAHATPIASNVVAASAGDGTAMFVENDGSLWAMGQNGYFQFGFTGLASTNRPIELAGFPGKAVAVAVSDGTALVLRNDGVLWVAGDNENGQLGLGAISYTSTWTEISNGVASVAAGWFHSAFLKADGTLWVMGDNSHGEMGNGTTTDQTTPLFVTNHVTAMAAGYDDTLFVRNDGSLWGMGYNEYGQLGDGTYSDTNRPVPVASNVFSVFSGQTHSLFVETNGTAWVMGDSISGQLGLGPSIPITNRPALMLGGLPVAGAFTGGTAIHTLLVAGPELPIISQQPSNQTLAAGNEAVFVVAASGFGPLSYQWQFDGTDIGSATAPNLLLPGLTAADAGSYKVVIVNPAGSVTSSVARLTLASVPGLTNISVLTNHTIKLLCASNELTIPGRIIATTNLLAPLSDWVTLTILPAGPAAPVQYIDSAATNYPSRFYRAVWP
jgi:alpha-tubulin suppressor-like RCC1 family protein